MNFNQQPLKHIITIAILMNCIVLFGNNPTPKQTTTSLDKPLNTNNSLLWQISGNNLQKPSYLYGTIHVISQDDFFIGKNVKKKLQKADKLIMEMDLNNMDVAALATQSLLDSGKTIKNYMNDSDYNRLESFMEKSIGIKKFTFESFYSRLKPLYLEQLIFFKYLGQEKESYEQNFKHIAEGKHISIAGLETMEEQLKFMDQISLETQLQSIIKTINNYKEETKKMDELVQYYKAQDLTALTKYFEEEDTAMVDNLLSKRNHNWIPKLISFIKDKPCFIAVGAGHLGGENGIINLLKKEGYTIEPISIN